MTVSQDSFHCAGNHFEYTSLSTNFEANLNLPRPSPYNKDSAIRLAFSASSELRNIAPNAIPPSNNKKNVSANTSSSINPRCPDCFTRSRMYCRNRSLCVFTLTNTSMSSLVSAVILLK